MRNTVILFGIVTVLIGTRAAVPMRAQQPVASTPTFTRDVAPILFKQCVSCHRPGEIAPMSLMTYEQARPWAKAILKVISNGTMPPWHTDAPAGTFHNERVLTDAERKTLMAWAAEGAPKGDRRICHPRRHSPKDGYSAHPTSSSRCRRTIPFPRRAPWSTSTFMCRRTLPSRSG